LEQCGIRKEIDMEVWKTSKKLRDREGTREKKKVKRKGR
jgi:hypothetical protein